MKKDELTSAQTEKKALQTKLAYVLLLLGVVTIGFSIRWHNIASYNTLWADDGGGHLTFVRTLIDHHRLPTLEETYLAWHEPLYYILVSVWNQLRPAEFFSEVDWWELMQIPIAALFIGTTGLLAYYVSKKNKWLALLNIFLYSVLFVSVKLSAYVNNELLAQALLLLLVYFFLKWRLLDERRYKFIALWSILAVVALMAKITAWVIIFAALFTWLLYFLITRSRHFIWYILTASILIATLSAPWVIYKQTHYGTYFTINTFAESPKQNIFTSDGWQYLMSFNPAPVTTDPYWYSEPHSFFFILASDTFGDYYNLFNNYITMETLPASEKLLVENGRFTTPYLRDSLLTVNRVGLVLLILWLIGFAGWVVQKQRNRAWTGYDAFLIIALVGGWGALLFHALRIPYYEAGIVKAHFILFTYPLLTVFAYQFWQKLIRSKMLLLALTALPIAVYTIVALPILIVQ